MPAPSVRIRFCTTRRWKKSSSERFTLIWFEERRFPMFLRIAGITLIVVLTVLPASAQFDRIFKGLGLGGQKGLSDAKIGEGLKEALKVGTENTVTLTGKNDGFFLNQAIKILMPEKLRTLEKGGRAVGYGPQVY